MNNAPIGVFDSGAGGLTVLAEIHKAMPQESLLYFGDSKNAPYGQYSEEECTRKAELCAQLLLSQGAKALVVACNLMSGIALPTLRNKLHCPVIGVIDAGVETVAQYDTGRPLHIGLLATPVLVNSEIYQKKLLARYPHMTVEAVPTPALVPLIEAGHVQDAQIRSVLEGYKSEFAKQPELLILGCTHYPLAADAIQAVFGDHVTLVNPAATAAQQLSQLLQAQELFCEDTHEPELLFLTSGDRDAFSVFVDKTMPQHSGSILHAEIAP